MSSSSEINTYLVTDSRYSNIKSQISIAVKDGPASVICQKYNPNSNSSSSTLWNVNINSENTLIDRNLKIEGTLQCYYSTTVAAADAAFSFYVAPAAFPLNQAIQSASFSINNAKVTVQSADILNVLTKQYHQRFLSQHCQMTPNYVDKYFGGVSDAVPESYSTDGLNISIPKPSSYMNGVGGAEKDSDTSGRMDFAHTVTVTFDNVVIDKDEFGKYNIGTGTAGTLIVQCSIKVSESIFGLPTVEIKENEANYLSINSLELNLMWNDMRNCFYISEPKVWACRPGTPDDSLVVGASTYLKLRQMSLHSSQYAKLSSRNILPYNEYVAHKKVFPSADGGTEQSNVLSFRQIPEKIMILIRPQYKANNPFHSNNLCFPLSKLEITFNNVAGLLSSHEQQDLYVMSRRNGSQQTWNEFIGVCKDHKNNDIRSLGSIVVIDPVRDLGLTDFLTSGSLGQFSFSCDATYTNILNHTNAAQTAAAPTNFIDAELVIITSNAGILITDKGSSSTMSGLLTKTAVLEAKASGKPSVDYEQVEEMAGGNYGKIGSTVLSGLMGKYKPSVLQAKYQTGKDMASKQVNVQSIQDKLTKYL
jgi:hypothetical protein